MNTEEGIVVRIDERGTWVKTTPSGACAGCSARGSCHSRPSGEEREVNVLNPVGAAVGDRILLGIASAPLLKATFLLYVFPVLALLAGALAGDGAAGALRMDGSALSVAGGLGAFGVAVLAVRRRANRLALRREYRPRILRVLSAGASPTDNHGMGPLSGTISRR